MRGKIIEIIWLAIIIALFIFSIKMIKNGELQSQIAAFGFWAPVFFIVLKISTLVVVPLGGTPLYLLSGAIFGKWLGFILCFLGDAFGSAVCFWISRRFGGKFVKFLAGEKFFTEIKKFVYLLSNAKSFIKARIAVFNIPEISAYAAGLSPINFWKFLVLQMPFFIPGTLLLVFFGYEITNLSAKYFFIFPLILSVFALVGFISLYKDYEKVESG